PMCLQNAPFFVSTFATRRRSGASDAGFCTGLPPRESMARMGSIRLGFILPVVMGAAIFCDGVQALAAPQSAPVSANGSSATQRDGSHDFDFLIGDWKAHVRRLPER